MKARYIIVVVIGTPIGLALAYFSTGSSGASNLSTGAVLGALLGLYFAAAIGRQPGAG